MVLNEAGEADIAPLKRNWRKAARHGRQCRGDLPRSDRDSAPQARMDQPVDKPRFSCGAIDKSDRGLQGAPHPSFRILLQACWRAGAPT